jgi:hypothetical protein
MGDEYPRRVRLLRGRATHAIRDTDPYGNGIWFAACGQLVSFAPGSGRDKLLDPAEPVTCTKCARKTGDPR